MYTQNIVSLGQNTATRTDCQLRGGSLAKTGRETWAELVECSIRTGIRSSGCSSSPRFARWRQKPTR